MRTGTARWASDRKEREAGIRPVRHDPGMTTIESHDWDAAACELDSRGWTMIPRLLTMADCSASVGLYEAETAFRKHVVMERHGYGRGEYRYFAYPLPSLVATLRTQLYSRLVPIANRWNERIGIGARFPAEHAAFLERCHRAGQQKPTPLLLRYGTGDFNCLHQDVYGEHVFPLQAAILLSSPGKDFTGGAFILTEQRPRMQSRAEVVPLGRGDAVIFAMAQRPQRGSRGDYRVAMRHGVSTVHRGQRHTLGIIFHDAA